MLTAIGLQWVGKLRPLSEYQVSIRRHHPHLPSTNLHTNDFKSTPDQTYTPCVCYIARPGQYVSLPNVTSVYLEQKKDNRRFNAFHVKDKTNVCCNRKLKGKRSRGRQRDMMVYSFGIVVWRNIHTRREIIGMTADIRQRTDTKTNTTWHGL